MHTNMTAQFVGRTTRSRVGFTLIELLIVIVILGISAAIAVPMISSGASMQIRAAAGMVAADLEYAKSMAISRGQMYAVVFDVDNERYTVQEPNGTPMTHPVTRKPYIVDFSSDSRLDRVEIDIASFDGTDTVKFNYLGSPFKGDNTDMNDGTITLQAGDFTRTISVEAVTGFISVSD